MGIAIYVKNDAFSPKKRFFGLCYVMDGGYKGWNPYRERHGCDFCQLFSI